MGAYAGRQGSSMAWKIQELSHGWRARVWDESSAPDRVSQDDHLLIQRVGVVRAAVLDGVTPTLNTRRPCGQDGAVWAAGVARTAFRTTEGLEDAVAEANTLLCDPAITARDNAQATCVACDLHGTGEIEFIRAGDCEAWTRAPGQVWRSLFPDPMWTTQASSEWKAWAESHPGATRPERQNAQARLMADEARWNTTPLGLFVQVKVQRATANGINEIVLASDGARLNAQRMDDLDGWMDGLRSWEEVEMTGLAAEKRHDDVTVIHLFRAAPSL